MITGSAANDDDAGYPLEVARFVATDDDAAGASNGGEEKEPQTEVFAAIIAFIVAVILVVAITMYVAARRRKAHAMNGAGRLGSRLTSRNSTNRSNGSADGDGGVVLTSKRRRPLADDSGNRIVSNLVARQTSTSTDHSEVSASTHHSESSAGTNPCVPQNSHYLWCGPSLALL